MRDKDSNWGDAIQGRPRRRQGVQLPGVGGGQGRNREEMGKLGASIGKQLFCLDPGCSPGKDTGESCWR